MQRLRDDHGGIAVIVALLMIPLVGFAAISVDVAAAHAERQQLQSGADAAAFAIGQECANGDCGTAPASTALTFAVANHNSGDVTAAITTPGLSPSSGEVTVLTRGTSTHWFAPVLGLLGGGGSYDEAQVSAEATVTWEPASGGLSNLPIVISLCEIQKLVDANDPTFVFNSTTGKFESAAPTGAEVKIALPHPSVSDPTVLGCIPDGQPHYVSGGFSWVTDDTPECDVYTAIGEDVGSDTGNDTPSACTSGYLRGLVDSGTVVALPVFDTTSGTGSTASYNIYGYVGFRLTGFKFNGNSSYTYGSSCGATGGTQCIAGVFSNLGDMTGVSSPTAPALGVTSVRLVK